MVLPPQNRGSLTLKPTPRKPARRQRSLLSSVVCCLLPVACRMTVPVVDVGEVRVRVRDRGMGMDVGVGLVVVHTRLVLVLVVLVVDVPVLVRDRFVVVAVLVALGQ